MITQENLQSFADHLRLEERSALTVEKYLRDVKKFLDFAGGELPSKDLTLRYKHHLMEKGYALRSVNSMLAALNCFLSFSGYEACKVKSLKHQHEVYRPEAKELTKGEYLRLVRTSGARGEKRLQLVLQTICLTGIRVSELRYFTVEAAREGTIRVSCKNKTRTILLPGKLRKLLLSYAKGKGIASGPIFITKTGRPLDRSNIWSKMKQLCREACVLPSKVFPHNLRKLFARIFYGLEKDIAKLADVLGHSSIETTRIYIMTTGAEHRKNLDRLCLLL